MYSTWARAARSNNDAIPRDAENLTIGQLARLTGLNAKTIRYYEEIGLLPRPPRGANGYRRYGTVDVNRLHLLQCIRLLGVPLSQAKPLLAGASAARCADVQRELQALVDARAIALDREIAELQAFREKLASYQRMPVACQPNGQEPFSACLDMRCIAPMSGVCDEEQDHVCC
ncbi:MAG TPA: MerR family DNA-binding transcriptional regulator [Ktedonobacterales bacterium]|nr:MerR family DNA-binding transcriptional regulator [Ktedonobacterales bacterium]